MTTHTGDPALALLRRAEALQSAARHAEAAACLERVLAVAPGHAPTLNALANSRLALGDLAASSRGFGRAVAVSRGTYWQAHHNQGVALRRAGHLTQAAAAFRNAAVIQPGLADLQQSLGKTFALASRFDESARWLTRACILAPANPDSRFHLALTQRRQGKVQAALATLQRVVAGMPAHHDAIMNVALIHKRLDAIAAASMWFGRAARLDPGVAAARLGHCMSLLPMLYESVDDIDAVRARYRAALEAFAADVRLDTPERIRVAAGAVGTFQPYYLAYQGLCDRDLQETYGRLMCRIMAARYPQWSAVRQPPPAEPDGRLRIGIVSGYFRWHTIWKLLTKGWVDRLDRSRFVLYGYATDPRKDTETALAAPRFDRFTSDLPTLEAWAGRIQADAPHILLYPEIGMDPMAMQIATLRLAPVQAVSWGHPDTTGMPTIDLFLSSRLMEPPGAQAHYSERLELLHGLGIHYEPPSFPKTAVDLRTYGVRPGAVTYLCCQFLSKYLPQHDHLLARIAAGVGDCQFLFINPKQDSVAERLAQRLSRAFRAAGLDPARHIVMLPYLSPAGYAAVNREADVYLDSLGWSGGNTTMEALAFGLPVVTMAGPLMRGRHSAAILTMAGMTETIAEDEDAYVATAVRLGNDPDWRAQVARRVAASRERVWRDDEAIRDLEDILIRTVDAART